jgi:hypothetical protein
MDRDVINPWNSNFYSMPFFQLQHKFPAIYKNLSGKFCGKKMRHHEFEVIMKPQSQFLTSLNNIMNFIKNFSVSYLNCYGGFH